jgi:hypothetical protein
MTWHTEVDVSGVDEGESHCDTWHCSGEWLGATWPNHGLPRGTPGLANEGYVKKYLGPEGFEPRTSHCSAFGMSLRPLDHRMVLVIQSVKWLFEFTYGKKPRGVGSGLSPDPGYIALHMTTATFAREVM